MRSGAKGLLWVGLVAVLVLVAVVGFVVYQLSSLHPPEAEGREIAEQLESELGEAHPDFTVQARADRSFAEVVLTARPSDGQLDVAELDDLVQSLDGIVAEHSGSRWAIRSTIEGKLDGSHVEIRGRATQAWPALSQVLESAGDSRTQVTVNLDLEQGGIIRDLDSERLCAAGADPHDFFADSLAGVHETASALGWSEADDPVLLYRTTACDPQMRATFYVMGPDRPQLMGDLATLIGLTRGERLTGLLMEETGRLILSTDGDPSDDLAPELTSAWPHGDVWLNGELAGDQ